MDLYIYTQYKGRLERPQVQTSYVVANIWTHLCVDQGLVRGRGSVLGTPFCLHESFIILLSYTHSVYNCLCHFIKSDYGHKGLDGLMLYSSASVAQIIVVHEKRRPSQWKACYRNIWSDIMSVALEQDTWEDKEGFE